MQLRRYVRKVSYANYSAVIYATSHKKVTMFVLADVFHSSGVLVHPLAVRRSPTDDFFTTKI